MIYTICLFYVYVSIMNVLGIDSYFYEIFILCSKIEVGRGRCRCLCLKLILNKLLNQNFQSQYFIDFNKLYLLSFEYVPK